MKRWMTVAILVVVTTLALTVVKPAPALADTTEDIIIWTAVGTGAAIVLVLIAVYFTRDEDAMFLTEPPRDPRQNQESRIHFGPECVKPDGTPALLCW
jgi:hypothetical protein